MVLRDVLECSGSGLVVCSVLRCSLFGATMGNLWLLLSAAGTGAGVAFASENAAIIMPSMRVMNDRGEAQFRRCCQNPALFSSKCSQMHRQLIF